VLSAPAFDQGAGSFGREMISYRRRHPPVARNLFVNLDAFLAHCYPPLAGSRHATCYVMTVAPLFCLNDG
jgi:hypothetical protein